LSNEDCSCNRESDTRRIVGSRPPTEAPWRKLMAFTVVGVMLLTGFAVFGQVASKTPAATVPAKATAVGDREANYTIDHMFELYLKSHDPAKLGHWNDTMGLNEWWDYRSDQYQEYQLRREFPFILNYNPYSTMVTPVVDQGGSITSWYRMTIDAKNLTNSALGPTKDPIFTPVLGNMAGGTGAWMNITWYGTYLEDWELVALRAGTHYGNTYYGVPAGRATPAASTDDGYYHELQGRIEFNRAAAAKVLGLTGAGDLRPQFNTSLGSITSAWQSNWLTEGSQGTAGIYDIYTAYDFNLAIQYFGLTYDPASTADNLIIRMYTISWGNECLLIRYLEAADVMRNWQAWMDDWYLNITVGPEAANVHSRGVAGYHLYATRDYLNNINGWALEASHMDWCGNKGPHTGYPSKYTPYDPTIQDIRHPSTAPLTMNYGKGVSYILAPLHWNLTATEKFTVKLPSASTMVPGYWPKSSTFDVLSDPVAKATEMNNSCTWGQLVVGNGYPNSGTYDLKKFYDKEAKTYTLHGPMSIPKNWNPDPLYPGRLLYGAPMFVMNVVKTQTLDLAQGWNLVSSEYVDYGYKASTLGLSSGDQVVQWDPATGVYKTYVVGMPLNDFAIAPSTGYWIFAGTAKTLTLFGDLNHTPPVTRSITIPAGGGWAIVALNSEKTTWKASDLAAMFSGGVQQVVKWNTGTQTYTTYVVGMPLNNFSIVPGQAYWIFCTASGNLSYTP
jgi:hypothetical protein